MKKTVLLLALSVLLSASGCTLIESIISDNTASTKDLKPPDELATSDSPGSGKEMKVEYNFSRIDGTPGTAALERAFLSVLSEQETAAPTARSDSPKANFLSHQTDMLLIPQAFENEFENNEDFQVVSVAEQALVFAVSADNPVTGLTSEQVKAIYSGEITNWNEVGGEDADIIVLAQKPTAQSSCYMTVFTDGAFDASGFTAAGYTINEDNAIIYTVYKNLTDDAAVKYLSIDGITPNQESINNREYNPRGTTQAVYRSGDRDAASLVYGFLTNDGQRAAAEAGYLPVNGIAADFTQANYLEMMGSGPSDTGERLAYYYTVPAPLLIAASADPANGLSELLVDKELAKEINSFAAAAVKELDGKTESFIKFLWLRGAQAASESLLNVEYKCLNGFLSVKVSFDYTLPDGKNYVYDCITATYDLYSGEKLEFSDLFFSQSDLTAVFSKDIASSEYLCGDFMFFDDSFAGFTVTELIYNGSSEFFSDGISVSFDSTSETAVTLIPRNMDGIWASETVIRAVNPLTTGEPEVLYTTAVYNRETEESLTYTLLTPDSGLNAEICDKINNTVLEHLEQNLSPKGLERAFEERGMGVNIYYYLNQDWKVKVYRDYFIVCHTDGIVEYIGENYEYGVYDGFGNSLCFDYSTGEMLDAAAIFVDGYENESRWYILPAEDDAEGEYSATPPDEELTLVGVDGFGCPTGCRSDAVALVYKAQSGAYSKIVQYVPAELIKWDK